MQVVEVGKPIHIICYSHTVPKWTYSGYRYTFLVKNVNVKENNIYRNNIYIKHATDDMHHSIFTCQGTGPSGQYFTENSTVHVGCKYFNIFISKSMRQL